MIEQREKLMSKRDAPNVYIRARVVLVTEKAIKIQPANQPSFYWLPKSQVINIDEILDYLTTLTEGDATVEYVDIEAKEWIVRKNGIPTVEDTGEEEEDFDFDQGF